MSNWKFNKDGWTDWMTHDGKGCPCVGYHFQAEVEKKLRGGGPYKVVGFKLAEGFAEKGHDRCWSWLKGYAKIVKYRVRKPKGLTMLEELLEKLPEIV